MLGEIRAIKLLNYNFFVHFTKFVNGAIITLKFVKFIFKKGENYDFNRENNNR